MSDIWSGTGDWSTSGDWSGGEPGAVTAAEVASGTADVSSSDFEDVSALTVDAGATVTVEGGLTVGDSHLNLVPNTLSVAGSLLLDGGSLTIGGFVTSASGNIDVSNGSSLLWELSGDASGLNIDLGSTPGDNFTFTQPFNGTITGFNSGDLINLSTVATINSTTIGASSVTFNTSAGAYTINFGPGVNMSDISVSGTSISTTQIVCFASGTRIGTTRGEVAVENLAIGDLVTTATGEARPIRWIGHTRVARPSREQLPVRVSEGAFGEGLPARDLMLSPGHAVCVDIMGEVFVPVSQLVNGASIAREAVSEVTYWHIELESHDVLLAEGLPCESYMDAGNRAFFGREYGRLEKVDPARSAESLKGYARPFVDKGAIVEAIRQRLTARAQARTGVERINASRAA